MVNAEYNHGDKIIFTSKIILNEWQKRILVITFSSWFLEEKKS